MRLFANTLIVKYQKYSDDGFLQFNFVRDDSLRMIACWERDMYLEAVEVVGLDWWPQRIGFP